MIVISISPLDDVKIWSFFAFKNKDLYQKLPLLQNDTIDIIEYRNDIEIYKNKKRRYKFEDLINK